MSSFLRLGRTYRHFRRYREVAMVLFRHQFGDLVRGIGLDRYLPLRKRRQPSDETAAATKYERVRLAFEELGPTFVKLGQFLSTRPDIVPDPMIQEFVKLQDEVKPFAGDEVRVIIETELGGKTEELFSDFEWTAHASASIAQVHRAVSRSGRELAIKVQRPGIRRRVEVDIEIMRDLAGLLESLIEGASLFEPARMVEEFARVIRREMDFATEAANMSRFARQFEGDKRVRVPSVVRDMTTTRVLTMDYIHGTKVTSREDMRAANLDPELLARRGTQLVLEQIFNHGFFHADPHPGNMLICPGNVICFLDYGMMGVLSHRHRHQLSQLIQGVVEQDEERITTAVFHLSEYKQYHRRMEIETRVATFVQDQLYRPMRDISVGQIMNDLARLFMEYGIRMPSDFFLLSKAVTTIEGVGQKLFPEFDSLEEAVPFVRKMYSPKAQARNMASEAGTFLRDVRSLVRDLPGDLWEVMRLVKHGEFKINFGHRGLEDLIASNEQITNRLVVAIVLAALLVGSSLMTLSGIPPTWHDIPIIGLVGFLVSGVISLWLIWSILRHGRM